jgi:UDP-N-acetylmuramyl pentapeptide synthase
LIKNTCNWAGKTIYYGNHYQILETTENSIKFIYEGNEYKLLVNGEFNVINSIAAIEIGKIAGLSSKKIGHGLLKYEPVGERGKIINLDKNIKIIADCYNANPDSMKASINSVISTYPDSDITLVLGNMAELGEYEDQMHGEIGEFLSEKSFSRLVTVGEKANLIAKSIKNKDIKIKKCINNQEAADFLKKNLSGNEIIFLKASRCMKLEEIAEELQKISV